MDKMKEHIYDESNGLHRDYLKEQHPARYSCLVLSGELWIYLADLND